MRKLLVVGAIALATAGLAACSSSKEASSDTAATPTTAASNGDGGGGATGGDFCAQWAEIQTKYADTFKSLQTPNIDPANPQAALTQLQDLGRTLVEPMKEFQAVAPAEIKGDIDALVNALQAMADGSTEGLAAAGPALSTAGTNIGQYLAANCAGASLAPTTAPG